jgi:hypothetical protein
MRFHASAAWLGEEFKNDQAPAASAQHTAGTLAEVRVEHVAIVPIGSLHTGWALKIAGIIRRPGSAIRSTRRSTSAPSSTTSSSPRSASMSTRA